MNLLPGVYVYSPTAKTTEICELLKNRGYKIYEREPRLHYLTDSVIYCDIDSEGDFLLWFANGRDSIPNMMLFYRFPINVEDQHPILKYFETLFKTGNAGFPRSHGLLRYYVEKVENDEGVTVIEPKRNQDNKDFVFNNSMDNKNVC